MWMVVAVAGAHYYLFLALLFLRTQKDFLLQLLFRLGYGLFKTYFGQ